MAISKLVMSVTIQDKIVRIKSLAKFINELRYDSDGIMYFHNHGSCYSIRINEKTLIVTETTWEESYHNGSAYDEKECVLSHSQADKALDALLTELQAKARSFAEHQINKEKEKEKIAMFDKYIETKISEMK